MGRPRTIPIHTTKEVCRKFKLRYASDLRQDDGEKLDGCVTSNDVIIIDSDLLDSDKISSLIHEVVHAACPDLNEPAVLRIESAVYEALKPFLR